MKKVLLIVTVIIFMTQGIALAGQSTGYSVTGVITKMTAGYDGTYAYISIDTGKSDYTCGGSLYAVRSDNPSFGLMSAAILTAFVMGQTVTLYNDGGACTFYHHIYEYNNLGEIDLGN